MIRDAIRKRHLIDWFVIAASATGITAGLCADELELLTRGKPHDLFPGLPICWAAYFLISWIVVAAFDSD